ncbi:MAG TPA: DsrE/DsrF/DrsH-like family protein [Candidatus Methanomethylicus sp.]|nr:DsrE/DsrF/DrsH-like family protein [Candidatus Methanomethylicus sp.]
MMPNRKKMLYVQTSGIEAPERLYAPFILAMTAKAMDMDAAVYFLIRGITVIKKGEAAKIKIGSFPSLKDVMDQAVEAGVELYACAQSCELMNMPKGDLEGRVKVAGAATLNDLVVDSDGVMYF